MIEWFDAAHTHHPHPLYPIKNLPGELPWLYGEVCDWGWDYLDPIILQKEYLVKAKMTVDKKEELARIKGISKPRSFAPQASLTLLEVFIILSLGCLI